MTRRIRILLAVLAVPTMALTIGGCSDGYDPGQITYNPIASGDATTNGTIPVQSQTGGQTGGNNNNGGNTGFQPIGQYGGANN